MKFLIFNKSIILKNISFSYARDGKNIIENLFVEIKKGLITGVIGESGSGKTTLINILLGLLKPDEGKICC